MIYITLIFIISFSFIIFFAQHGKILNSIYYSDSFKWNKYYIYSFIVLLLLMGLRVGVGRDFQSYDRAFYINISDVTFNFGETTEYGQIYLIWILNKFNFSSQSYFFITSLITIFLFYKSFKNLYFLLPAALFVFFTADMFLFSLNGIRQGIAMMAFFNALRFPIVNSNFKENIIKIFNVIFYLIIGYLFHNSILFFTPLLILNNKRILSLFNSKILIIIIFIGFFINGMKNINLINVFSDMVINYLPKYAPYLDFNKFSYGNLTFGKGAMLYLIIYLIPIFYYDKIKKIYNNIDIYFVLFAIGLCIIYSFINEDVMLIMRLLRYLLYCNIFVLSAGITYLFKYNGKYYNILASMIIIILIVKFLITMNVFMDLDIQDRSFSLFLIPFVK